MASRNIESYGWNWRLFMGSREALKWNRRDLPCLAEVLALVSGRTAVVQAGGNLGIWPKLLAKHFATVYTFEPAPDLFPILMANAPEKNIVRFQAALGDRPAFVHLAQTRRDAAAKPKNPAHEGITHIDGPGTIPTLRLDDFGFKVLDLLYLDLEGWELYALQGAAATLRSCRPVVAVEVNKNLRYLNITPEQVHGVLRGCGYQYLRRVASDDVFLPVERAPA